MKPARSVTQNLGAKILAVAVALLVWFNASGQEEVARVRNCPLVLESVPDSLAVASQVPTSADVRIHATRRRMLALGFQRVTVAVDLTGLAAGRQRIALGPDHVRVPGGLDRGSVQVLSPAVLDLDLEAVVMRRVQVSLTTQGLLSNPLLLLESGVTVEPAWVTVRGPGSTLERIRHVPTAPVDLSRVRESGTREVSLVFDRETFSCEPERVSVTFRVSRKRERVLANVPATVILDSEDFDAEVVPGTVSLNLEGPAAVLDTLSSRDVSVRVNLGGRAPATYRLSPEVVLPAGVRMLAMSTDTLEVRVFRPRR